MASRQLDLPSPGKPSAAGGGRGRRGGGAANGGGDEPTPPADASLSAEAQRRYLNYAVSVITSRALPDVRDGLKPVQRRILYAMYANLHLYPDAKFRKSATIIGEVLGKFHPHGDSACYDAMVRMAQPFSMRVPLVDGHGNFGSLDGDAPAAYRYTEARLAPLAMDLLEEIRQGTVDFRPNYDGTTEEPIVVPAKIPQLLVNGCTGIAVGMATNIPPHNLSEVCAAAVAMIDDRSLETKDLLKHIKGPDFPTGGQVINSKKELREIYERGQGPIRLRGEWKTESGGRGGAEHIVVTSIPYGLTKAAVVERIAEVIIAKKLPMLVDVRDESTDDVRVVLELKSGADPALVMAYLYKHTPLESGFHVNLTCLVPTQNREIAGPLRVDLAAMLREFLTFREETVRRRFEFELAELERRIHILQGFAIVFDALDEAIRIIRKSDGKADAAVKLSKRFELSDAQTDAILELKLYKLARLEIDAIMRELKEKQERAKEIRAILADKKKLLRVVRSEIAEVAERFPDKRRTKISGAGEETEFVAEDFIVDEEVTVILTRDGWLKRVREVKDLSATRLREGDAILAVIRGSTKEPIAVFSNQGSAYVIRIHDVPASTGYGEPVQKLFNFRDGERVVGALAVGTSQKGVLALAVSKGGFGLRFNLDPHRELSTRAGRRFARPGDGDEIVGVALAQDKDVLCVVTSDARALLCKVAELPDLANPGRGVTVIKTGDDAGVIGFGVGGPKDKDVLIAETDDGKELPVGPGRFAVTGRGGKGHTLKRKTKIVRAAPPLPTTAPPLLN
jgi:DNA gyrase subunit A